MLDKAIINGTVVTPTGVQSLDIGIRDGRIVALVERGALPAATEVIDASGLTVIPGGIDPHIHCDLEMGGITAFGPDQVGKAALIGGTTTLVDFAWKEQDETVLEAVARTKQRWDAVSPIDFAFHVVLRGQISRDVLAQIPEAIEAGHPSYKVFTTNVFPHEPIGGQDLKIDYGSLKEVLEVLRDHRGIAMVHAEDDDLVQHNYRRHFEDGKTHYTNMHTVHTTLSEDLAFRRTIRLAAAVGDVPLYFAHVSARTGVDAIAEARAEGLPVYGETLHQYALHTHHDYAEPDGMKYHTYPSLHDHEDTERLWSGVADGSISCFGTDGQATTYEVKTQFTRIDDVTGGNAGVEPRVALLYTEMVDKRGMSLETYVDAVSSNAAKILGLYPAKGAIAVGSDADLVALRTGLTGSFTAATLHETDYTPWEGWDCTAWPAFTVLRGEVVARDNEFVGQADGGKIVPRALAPEILDARRYA